MQLAVLPSLALAWRQEFAIMRSSNGARQLALAAMAAPAQAVERSKEW
jgi:hypothetical protein